MAKGKTKARLPKRVAGIRIPKAVRRNSGWLIQLLQTPQVQAAVASGLAAASAALAGDKTGKMTAKQAKRRLKFATEEGVDRVAALADAVGAAVTTSLESWFYRPGAEKAANRPDKSPPTRDRGDASAH